MSTGRISYKTLDDMASKLGGVFFIIRATKKTENGVGTNKKSGLIEFNIANGFGLYALFECEKVLSDQSVTFESLASGLGFLWFGEFVDSSGKKYIGTDYGQGNKSAPTTTTELIHRVNETIEKCKKEILEKKGKNIHIEASNRMNGMLSYYKQLGDKVEELYPALVH